MLHDPPQEKRIADKIAPSQPARLAHQPVGPFKAHVTHPLRRAFGCTCLKIEQGANRTRHGAMRCRDMGSDEQFLQRHAHGDQQDIRPVTRKSVEDYGHLSGCEKPIRIDTKVMLRRAGAKSLGSLFGNARPPADQPDAQGPLDMAKKARHEIRSIEIGGEFLPIGDLACDIDADTIGQHEKTLQGLPIGRIRMGNIGAMGVEPRHALELSVFERVVEKVERFVPVETGDLDAENIAGVSGVLLRHHCAPTARFGARRSASSPRESA